MPQAAPIYWLFMLMFFSASFMFFLIMNYFFKHMEKMSFEKKVINIKSKNWKW